MTGKNDAKIVMIGAGRMATAIAGGMVRSGFDRTQITAFDCNEKAAAAFTAAAGVAARTGDAAGAIAGADAVLLAVKPQYLAEAVAPYRELLAEKLLISIAAGVPMKRLAELTGAAKIVRVMPNTPALYGAGCGAYALRQELTAPEMELVTGILESIGEFYRLEEKLLDAVTALSGSGPAYGFEMIQAMADGGVTAGLPRAVAQRLAALTLKGAAEMVLASGTHPMELRDQVCSPAGTTITAVNVLAERGFAGAVVEAEMAAYRRSMELGQGK